MTVRGYPGERTVLDRSSSGIEAEDLVEGHRLSRFIILRDIDGRRHAVSVGSIAALGEVEDGGTILLLPGGRLIRVAQSLDVVLRWLVA